VAEDYTGNIRESGGYRNALEYAAMKARQTGLLEAMAKQVDPDWRRPRIDQLVAALANAGLVRDLGRDCEIHPLLTSYLRSRNDAPEACQRAFVDVMGGFAGELAVRPYYEQRAPFALHKANFHFALHLSHCLAMDLHFAMLTQSLAAYEQNSRNFLEASRLFTQLAKHHSVRANWEAEASAYHQLGTIALNQQDFATAREWYVKSLAISEKQGDLHGAAITYHQLGMIAQRQQDFATAREWYLKSLDIKEKQGNLEGVAKNVTNWAESL
jgi:tetratricopeptide (TPR) repeat protein